MSVFQSVMATIPVTAAINRLELVQSAAGQPVQLRAAGADTNIGIAVLSKGTGALMADVPDNVANGGNARGANAVDWQQVRAAASHVASGFNSTIGGGSSNTASGAQATVAGGTGNNAGSTNATVGGGSGNSATAATSVIAGGTGNVSSGARSWIPGGGQATTRAVYGRGAWNGGQIAAVGDTQAGEHVLCRQTTDATATRLTADNAAPGANNQIVLPNFASYAGVLRVTAKAQGATDAAHWILNCGAVRGANAAATTVQGGGASIAPTLSSGAGSAWRLDVSADTTNGALGVTVTGAAGVTIIWAARFANIEAVTAS